VRVSLIVNVSASAVTPRVRVVLAQALAAEHDLEVLQTAAPGHATALAAEAAGDGRELVAVLGGDGTLNEAANGLFGTASTLAVLPGGSTNVMARTLGVKEDPVEANLQLLEVLRRPSSDWRRTVGLGSVNGRYFLFHTSVGFDAAIVERVERRGGLKRYASHPVFFFSALDTWFRHYDRGHAIFRVKTDAGDIEDGYMAVFLNSDPYTYFGSRPLHLAPGTDLVDNALSAVVFRTLRLHTLFGVAGRAMASGRSIARHSRLTTVRDQSGLLIEAISGPLPHQCDGEFLGRLDYLEVRHHPSALNLLVPPPDPPRSPRRPGRWLRRR
jgi:diacylglycerol kinase family enzyme